MRWSSRCLPAQTTPLFYAHPNHFAPSFSWVWHTMPKKVGICHIMSLPQQWKLLILSEDDITLVWDDTSPKKHMVLPFQHLPDLCFSSVVFFFSSCKWKLNWSVITQVPFLPFRGRYWESFTAVRFLTYPPKFIRKHHKLFWNHFKLLIEIPAPQAARDHLISQEPSWMKFFPLYCKQSPHYLLLWPAVLLSTSFSWTF